MVSGYNFENSVKVIIFLSIFFTRSYYGISISVNMSLPNPTTIAIPQYFFTISFNLPYCKIWNFFS